MSRWDTLNPRDWSPSLATDVIGRPAEGALIGWSYAAWRVLKVRVREEADWTDEDRQRLQQLKPSVVARFVPYTIVLEHVCGPTLVDRTQKLHDGRITIHLGVRAGSHYRWAQLHDRYPICSCHGHPWPCIEVDRDRVSARAAAVLERELAGAQPGVCPACLEPITRRQQAVRFPEPNLTVPGAAQPTYHARSQCWRAAVTYEQKRLKANPQAERLVTCPGTLFQHRLGGLADCSAGEACTGHHGPPSLPLNRRAEGCVVRIYRDSERGYPRPTRDCGFRRDGRDCLGAERTDKPQVEADLLGDGAA